MKLGIIVYLNIGIGLNLYFKPWLYHNRKITDQLLLSSENIIFLNLK